MLRYTAIPTDIARAYQAGRPDVFDHPPERATSDGGANPCRHCLKHVPAGADMLILAHKPFPGTHAYTEIGPIFLCADPCTTGTGDTVPEILTTSPDYLVRGYATDDRIVYGTGAVIQAETLPARSAEILSRSDVAYLHVRSARNTCYQLRIDRAG